MIIPNEGKILLLSQAIGKTSNASLLWRMGMWDGITGSLNDATVFSDITFCSYSGYAPIDLPQATWLTPTIVSNVAQTTWGTVGISWLIAAPAPIVRGWALYSSTLNKLIAVQELATPITTAVGGSVNMLPFLSDKSIP